MVYNCFVIFNYIEESMKKLFITMCVVLLSMTAQAQEKGDFALGVHAGATFSKIEFMGEKDSNTTFGIGAFGQYNFANKWRLELEANYHPDSGIQLGAGLQFNLSGNYFLSGEYKYQPGLFGDGHVLMVGLGYRF